MAILMNKKNDKGKGKLTKPNEIDKGYTSLSYKDRYKDLMALDKIAGGPNDLSSLEDNLRVFTKVDSAYYTPVLDKLNKYAKTVDKNKLSDTAKKNIKVFANSLEQTYSGYNRRPRNIAPTQDMINKEIIPNISNKEIGNIMNTDFDKVKDMGIFGKTKLAYKLKPENVNIGKLIKAVKFINSDEGYSRFPNMYNTADEFKK